MGSVSPVRAHHRINLMDRSHRHCSGHSVYGSDHLGDTAAEQTLKTWNFEMTLRLFESSRKAVLIGKKMRRG
jgi:hypothetical protein